MDAPLAYILTFLIFFFHFLHSTVNVNFTTDVLRPVDLHVDVLNAQTKTYYAGSYEQFDTMAGSASLTIKMSDQASEPFLWKVFLTPRDEP